MNTLNAMGMQFKTPKFEFKFCVTFIFSLLFLKSKIIYWVSGRRIVDFANTMSVVNVNDYTEVFPRSQ